jgi:cytochrome b pre-mRNA-processing protein 3
MKLAKFFHRRDPAASMLYEQIVGQARRPEFYLACGVPDTVQGRFEMIALHMFLVLHRLKREGEAATSLAQDLFDLMFQDMDRNLRELGTGDLAVGKRIKTLAKGLYGRIAAYERGLGQGSGQGSDAGPQDLELAVARNVFPQGAPPAACLAALVDYLRRSPAVLAAQAYGELAAGRIAFAAAPVLTSGSVQSDFATSGAE